ncbi:MAG: class I SAM-dependent methyltransferase [Gammaproteobacteria bacterium]
MGLRRSYLRFIRESVESTIGGFAGKRMLELGNQRIARRALVGARTGKAYYTALGVYHTSLDCNGKDGAVPLDLSVDIEKPEWEAHFDVITNAGTTEHVEPFEAQYTCFRNLHRWMRPGGIQVHFVPAIEGLETTDRWTNHCNNYYSAAFFEMLARENGYELVASTVINHLRAACVRKVSGAPFMDDRALFLRHVSREEGGIDYSRPRPSLWRRLIGRRASRT